MSQVSDLDLSNIDFSEDTPPPPKPEDAPPPPKPEDTPPPKAGGKTPPAKKTLKKIEATATGSGATDSPKIDKTAPIADTTDPANLAKKVKDEDLAKVHAEMWVFTFELFLSSAAHFLTGQPASRYSLTPTQKSTYTKVSFEYFKVATWGISPALAFWLQTATMTGTIGMLCYFDWKEKVKREEMIMNAAIQEQQKQAAAHRQAALQKQNPQQEQTQYQEQPQEQAKPPAVDNKTQKKELQKKANDLIEMAEREANGIPKELTADYLTHHVHELVQKRISFETYGKSHQFEGHYIKNNSYERAKYEDLQRDPVGTRPSSLIAVKINELKAKGLNVADMNKKIRHYLQGLRITHGFETSKEKEDE